MTKITPNTPKIEGLTLEVAFANLDKVWRQSQFASTESTALEASSQMVANALNELEELKQKQPKDAEAT